MSYLKTLSWTRQFNWIQPLLLGGVLIAFWHLMVERQIWDRTIVPSPSRTVSAAWEFRLVLMQDTLVTLCEVALGFLITVGSAIFAAVAIHVLPHISRGVYGFLVVLQSVPLWGIAPVLFYWVGPGLAARLIVIILVAFFPVLVNTVEGLRQIDRDLLDLFDSMNATKWQKLTLLEIPSAIRMVLAGSKITLTMCLIGAVLAETLIGDMVGLGYRIKEANAHFRIDLVFASIALMSLIVVFLYGLLTLIANQLQPWVNKQEK